MPEHDSRQQALTWEQTLRAWETYKRAGLSRVETTAPDMTGIRFYDRCNEEEKREMHLCGLRFIKVAGAWLKAASPEARTEMTELARQFAEARMQSKI